MVSLIKHDHGLIQVITQNQLLKDELLANAIQESESTNQNLIDIVLQQYQLHPDILAKACAKYYQLPFVSIQNQQDLSLDNMLVTLMDQYRLLPLYHRDQKLIIAISDPYQLSQIEQLKNIFSLMPTPVFVNHIHYRILLNQRLCQYRINQLTQLPNSQNVEQEIILFIEQLIGEAISRDISDLHGEPMKSGYRVRMRIDGLLQEMYCLPAMFSAMIVSRFKIMANLDIAQRRLPQDGRFQFISKDGLHRDCRLNCCPTLYGEKIVLRLLHPQRKPLPLAALGLSPNHSEILQYNINRSQGLILITGPTGSGKTTTLYTALHLLNQQSKNIQTIEDPIEIELSGINQTNIQPAIGFDFNHALRAFLRQDPDVLMIGEIRDSETAQIAIRAAQTGHLVLSSLHTNHTADAIIRLINLNIAPINIVNALKLIIAQRLLRKLCPYCRPTPTATEPYIGCRLCAYGYKNRCGVFEIMPISPLIQDSILKGCTSSQLTKIACEQGMQTLWQAGEEKVKLGITSLHELYRNIPLPIS